jgi:two-component system, NtrC family, nitrogen regulation sensor histidine kinase NtrY
VRVSWALAGGSVAVVITDDGPGVADTANLFVPFFTTKPTGSGIGLPLARQIAEAYGVSLSLRNRRQGRGAEAVITLPAPPLQASQAAG